MLTIPHNMNPNTHIGRTRRAPSTGSYEHVYGGDGLTFIGTAVFRATHEYKVEYSGGSDKYWWVKATDIFLWASPDPSSNPEIGVVCSFAAISGNSGGFEFHLPIDDEYNISWERRNYLRNLVNKDHLGKAIFAALSNSVATMDGRFNPGQIIHEDPRWCLFWRNWGEVAVPPSMRNTITDQMENPWDISEWP